MTKCSKKNAQQQNKFRNVMPTCPKPICLLHNSHAAHKDICIRVFFECILLYARKRQLTLNYSTKPVWKIWFRLIIFTESSTRLWIYVFCIWQHIPIMVLKANKERTRFCSLKYYWLGTWIILTAIVRWQGISQTAWQFVCF